MNLDRLAHWVAEGRITSTPEKPITASELLLSGCIHDVHDGVKVLADVRSAPHAPSILVLICLSLQGAEQLKVPIHITPSKASNQGASTERLGGCRRRGT